LIEFVKKMKTKYVYLPGVRALMFTITVIRSETAMMRLALVSVYSSDISDWWIWDKFLWWNTFRYSNVARPSKRLFCETNRDVYRLSFGKRFFLWQNKQNKTVSPPETRAFRGRN